MDVYIKNMVCLRCIIVVQLVLERLELDYAKVELGIVKLIDTVLPDSITKLNDELKVYDLEVIGDRKQVLVEKIKLVVVEIFRSTTDAIPSRFSEYLSRTLFYDYTYLSNVFSEVEGSTIERFYIVSRIERAKELMVYEALTITEIAYKLNFSSVSHFCLQFKKIAGKTPANFKRLCQSKNFVWREV